VSQRSAALAFCDDAGATERQQCLFGEVFSDVRASPLLTIESERWIRSLDGIDELVREQMVRAVQQSSHSDVTTAEEALSRVDQQEVRLIEFSESEGGRAFSVLEYGVGDNSYGAYFQRDATNVLAAIHDGDVLDCSVFTDGL